MRHSSQTTSVARFADALLADDLPALPDDHRAQAVAFIAKRVSVLPSITRLGVLVIAAVVALSGRVLGMQRVIAAITETSAPLVSEYPRLVRSLGYAFVWETWPGTATDGAQHRETASASSTSVGSSA